MAYSLSPSSAFSAPLPSLLKDELLPSQSLSTGLLLVIFAFLFLGPASVLELERWRFLPLSDRALRGGSSISPFSICSLRLSSICLNSSLLMDWKWMAPDLHFHRSLQVRKKGKNIAEISKLNIFRPAIENHMILRYDVAPEVLPLHASLSVTACIN